MTMTEQAGHIIWRVTPADDSAGDHAFDARLIVHDFGMPDRPADEEEVHHMMRARERAARSGTFFRQSAPFEARIPNEPLTLVVMPSAGSPPLVVWFDTFDASGTKGVSGYSSGPCTIIVHLSNGTAFTSLPKEAYPLPIELPV